MSTLKFVHGERLDRHGYVLLLAAGVGEAQVDEFDLLLFDHFHDIIGRHCHFAISSGFADYWFGGKTKRAGEMRLKISRIHAIRRKKSRPLCHMRALAAT